MFNVETLPVTYENIDHIKATGAIQSWEDEGIRLCIERSRRETGSIRNASSREGMLRILSVFEVQGKKRGLMSILLRLEPPMGSRQELVLEKPWWFWMRLPPTVLLVPILVPVVDG